MRASTRPGLQSTRNISTSSSAPSSRCVPRFPPPPPKSHRINVGNLQLLVRAAPGRQVFYEALGSPRERVVVDLDRWLSALEGQVGRLEKFYAEGK